MRNKTNNIETRDKQSKLIQRFDGIEDNNPPTNPIDGKKTGILYTSDYIDKDSYPDTINPLDNKYEESIAALDKLQRPGEWVYELDLEYRSSVTPDYGYGLLNVNDFFTIKKNIPTEELCYPVQFPWQMCAADFALPKGWISYDSSNAGETVINLYHNYPDFLTNCDGWEIQSSSLTAYANIPGPYYVNIISGPVNVGIGLYRWQIEIVNEFGIVVESIGFAGSPKNDQFCLYNRSELFINAFDYPTVYLAVGDTISSTDFSACGDYTLPSDTWTVTAITEFQQNGILTAWIITIENENGDRPYFENRPCKGEVCFNIGAGNPTYNNDVRGYIKSIEEVVEGCASPIGLLNSLDWGDLQSIDLWISSFLTTGVQYDSLPNQCCPDCPPYAVGSIDTFKFLFSKHEYLKSKCCFNVKTTSPGFTQLASTMGWYCDNKHECCDTDFVTCVDEILSLAPNYDTYLTWLDKGIVEYSTLGGTSGLCDLYDYILSIPVPQFQTLFLNLILNNGLVVVCDSKTGEYTTFYGIEAYSNSLQPLPQP